MKKIYLLTIILGLLATTACEKGFEEMNKDQFNPTETSLSPVFNSMLSSLVREWQPQTGLEYENMGFSSQMTNIYGTSGYLLSNASNDLWNNYYKYFSDVKLYERLLADYDKNLNLANMIAQKDVIHAYKTVKMIDIFGDIPYYDAGKAIDGVEYFYPKYDDQKTIYLEMLNLLDEADANMVETPGDDYAILGSYDVLFGDDITMWRKFANSIRLRHALKAYDADNTVGTHIADILGGNLPLVEDGEDIELDPVALDLDLRGRIWAYSGGKVRFGTTMFDAMSDGTLETDIFDPRLRLFSEVNSSGDWNAMPFTGGGIVETGNPNAESRRTTPSDAGTYTYSPINYWMLTSRYYIPEQIITAAEVHFLKAEAYAKGAGVAVDLAMARTEYEAGIKSSIDYWFNIAKGSRDFADEFAWQNVPPDPIVSEVDAMLANPKVAWVDADALELIYTQRWISHIRQIRQGWNVYRQTKMTPHTGPEFVFNRLIYPSSEHNNNADNYATQVAKMGSDDETVKVWWAK